ncbi:MAG TPA: pirin-like C-terminal cupin domain-containing protein [Cyclobacteriaceae bacterium]|nr:pirin-like C-terminal cupin domain-containing protein [Cyclobacteriaceae bacterium]
MTSERKLERVETPTPQQGFLGAGHIARALIRGDFENTDPFIILMDDRIVVPPGDPVGAPHPHAGLETVSLILDGKLGEGVHAVEAGDFELMTAGGGVIHTESMEPGTKLRVLQMWLTLPRKDRWAAPRLQRLRLDRVPKHVADGEEIRVYSGSFAGVTSPVQNYVPLTVADIRLRPGALTRQMLPGAHTSLLYIIEGSLEVGEEGRSLSEDQMGWLAKTIEDSEAAVLLKGGPEGARLVLYSAPPQHESIASYGPFIGNRQQDIIRLYNEYHQGKMKHISTVEDIVNF